MSQQPTLPDQTTLIKRIEKKHLGCIDFSEDHPNDTASIDIVDLTHHYNPTEDRSLVTLILTCTIANKISSLQLQLSVDGLLPVFQITLIKIEEIILSTEFTYVNLNYPEDAEVVIVPDHRTSSKRAKLCFMISTAKKSATARYTFDPDDELQGLYSDIYREEEPFGEHVKVIDMFYNPVYTEVKENAN